MAWVGGQGLVCGAGVETVVGPAGNSFLSLMSTQKHFRGELKRLFKSFQDREGSLHHAALLEDTQRAEVVC